MTLEWINDVSKAVHTYVHTHTNTHTHTPTNQLIGETAHKQNP